MANDITSADAHKMPTLQLVEILEKAAIGFRIRMETGTPIAAYSIHACEVETVAYELMQRGY